MATPSNQSYRAPGPYDEDYRSIARREQMAQILQQQALQPIDVGSYQGIQAPISPLSGIAKILQGYLAGQQMDKADEGRKDLSYRSDNADRALVGLPPIDRTKPQQLAQALEQPTPTTYGEGMPPTGMPSTSVPQPQTMPVAQSFPIGPSGAYQNLPPNQEIDMQPQTAPTQSMPPQGAPIQAVAPKGQFTPPGGGSALPSVTGDPAKDLALLKQFRGDTAAYIKFAYEQNKPIVGAAGSTLLNPQGKMITSLPDANGNVRIQNRDGSYRVEKAANVNELQRNEAFTKEYATQGAKATVERDTTQFGLAESAPQNIEKANQIIDLIDSGALTGTAAETKLQIARMFNVTGNGPEETIKKTELLISSLGRNVLDNIRASGLGAGQGFTDNDRKFLERVVGGSIELNGKTLKDLARLQKLSNQRSVEKWNKRVGEIDPNVRKDMGFKPIELGNTYSQSEIRAELKRRGLTQ
tara:strand:+ start:61 stop:1467 length:1407 start_codon:yes stop_codon:yes gene_type:complete